MRTKEESAALYVARVNEENAWAALCASDWANPCNQIWDDYSNAAKIVEGLELPQN